MEQNKTTEYHFIPGDETWVKIKGHEHYEVSDYGRVRRTKDKRLKKLKVDYRGYHLVTLHTKSKRSYFKVHRLVAQAFIPNPENKAEVNHINGKAKSFNHISNLEWSTRQENMEHAKKEGLMPSGQNHPRATLTDREVEDIRNLYIPRDKEYGARVLAEKYEVSPGCIYNIIAGRSRVS